VVGELFKMVRKLSTSIIFFLITAISFSATAQSIKDAKKYYDIAEKEYDTSDFSNALKNYTKAFDISKKYVMYFSIAQCHRHLKHYAKALFFYKRFLAKFPNSAYKSEVEKQIGLMEKAISDQKTAMKTKGRVSIVTTPEGAQVLVDNFTGKPEGITPVVLYIAPGTHLLVLKKEGYKTLTTKVTVAKGDMKFINLSLVSLTSTTENPKDPLVKSKDPVVKIKDPEKKPDGVKIQPDKVPEATGPTPFYKTWWFYTGVGAAVVFTGITAYEGMVALDKQTLYDDEKGSTTPDEGLLKTLKDDGEQAAMISTVFTGLAVGAVIATVVGIVLYNPESDSSSTTPEGETAPQKTSFSILPTCSGDGCGIWATFRF
jgi:PEGA domain